MSRKPRLPILSRVDFYRFKEDELILALSNAIENYANQQRAEKLTENCEALRAWGRLLVDVPNGGFEQFFFNHRGDHGVEAMADQLDAIAVPKAGPLLRDAVAVYHQHLSRFDVENPWDGLFGSIKEFDKLARGFNNVTRRANVALEKWIRSNIVELATGEDGEALVPEFTGAVETKHSNGLVSEYLEVKKGKPNGAYREFFEDGTVRKVVFYKSGKVSGDFWPEGQLKRKESKRGTLTIIEWFYPSGQLQKRYVHDKTSYAVEPVRLFHENGQLAEEFPNVGGKNCGPWMKFFDDGSPKLVAEYTANETLVIQNAWDDNRNQIVTNGTGTFRSDEFTIDWRYSVFWDVSWICEQELKNGICHGKSTKYHCGVLNSISNFVDGVEHGELKSYWNNGSVRSVTNYVQGIAGATESFPKFDCPMPAVVLSVEANERLYTNWKHIPVDEYPLVLNLDEIQQQLKVPLFLQKVHERNLAGTIQSDYEDWNCFDDGIAYLVTVNEAGDATNAVAKVSRVYSGGLLDTYPPLLLKLRFTPGRVRGRAIECRVLAHVDHRFVEGGSMS